MVKNIFMKKSTKGFYTIEASIFLPITLLAVLLIGFIMKVDGTWENCIHGAVDESRYVAAEAYDRVSPMMIGKRVGKRVIDDNPNIETVRIRKVKVLYRDLYADDVISYKLAASFKVELPLGMSREFPFEYGIKFRGFTGLKSRDDPLGVEGLEAYDIQNPVFIFPWSGEKYHGKSCTYVTAQAHERLLTKEIRRKYKPCKLCNSEQAAIGNKVFCFESSDSAYHMPMCSTVVKKTIVVDKNEAISRGYSPCSKCGGE